MLNVSVEERISYYAERAALAQIRLYGSKFDQSDSSICAYTVKRPTLRDMWTRYLKREAALLGKYQLIFPTDDYPDQITSGKQLIYDSLLQIAAVLFWKGRST